MEILGGVDFDIYVNIVPDTRSRIEDVRHH